MDSEFDYIIVGAGSAGCVMANRLSADLNVSVLLIESGPSDQSPLIKMPRGIGKILEPGNSRVWDYQALPATGKPSELWLKGRTLGGSSSVNGMVYMRGAPADYDGWAAAGCEGWGWEHIQRQYVALENHILGSTTWRGENGPMGITVHPKGNELLKAILSAASDIGTPQVDDINSMDAVQRGGLGYQARNIWRGQRCSAADAFLKPVLSRKNLHVITDSTVSKIEFKDKRAAAIQLTGRKGTSQFLARREIILCAGAIETPKLLQLSGIGCGRLLQSLGVSLVHNAPNVGRNLREHRYLAMQYRVNKGSLNGAFQGLGLAGSLFQYLFNKSGPMSHAAHEAGGVIKTLPSLDRPSPRRFVSS